MLINATLPEEDRVAIVDDGVLTELDIEIAGRQQTKSNIYLGEIVRVEQGLQAAFVDYGAARPGFLQIGEIHPSLYPPQEDGTPTTKRLPINQILKRGQQILVQVVKEERGNKGAAITTEISLPGRYMVLMPESNSRGISRKIENESVRKGIKQAIAELELPENMGYIIRTAAIDQPPEELKRDFDYLLSTYNSIISHSKTAKAPALIYQESNLVIRCIRDYFSPEIDEVLIDDRKVFQEARDFFKAVMPEYVSLVKLHQERRPIFARYQIEEQIAQLSSNTVNLPSGGSIVLDQTEALVAIDVNSGKMGSEQDVEATAHRVNLEAATEVARQLRLRDMGGLIVIDFIDMRQRKNGREVEKALKTGLKIDKARVTVGRISHQFGLLEMSRQRIKGNLGEGAYYQCPHCQGSGRIKSAESRSIALLRRIQAGTAKGNIDVVSCTAAVDVVNYILNNKRVELLDLEQRYNLKISINADHNFLPEQTELEFIKQSKEAQNGADAQAPLVEIDVSERNSLDTEANETPALIGDTAQDSSDTRPIDQGDEATPAPEKKRPRRRRRPNRRRNDSNKSNEQTPQSQNATDNGTQQQPLAADKIDNQVVSDEGTSINTPPEGVQPDSVENSNAPVTSTVKDSDTTDLAPTISVSAANESKNPAPAEQKKPVRRRSTNKKAQSAADKGQDQNKDHQQPEASTDTDNPEENSALNTTGAIVASDSSVKTPPTTQPSTSSDGDSGQSSEVKKPVRRRRSTKKTATAETPAADKTTAEQEATTAPAAAKTTTTKPRRKTSAKTAAKKATDTEELTPEETKPAPAKKPVRRRTTTKKTAPTDEQQSATETPTAPTSAATDEEKTAKKPVRRRRTTKKTEQKTTAETTTTDEQASAPASTPPTSAATDKDTPVKKPVRRRRTTKKTEPSSSAEESTKE